MKPLQVIFDQKDPTPSENRLKRIFIITDGDIDLRCEREVSKLVEQDPNICIHTFGIGQLCKRKIVQDLATAGGGHCSILESIDNTNLLEDKVEEALQLAIEPSLRNCSLQHGYHGKLDEKEDLKTIFRHQLIQRQYISPLQDFIALKIKFDVGLDTYTKKEDRFDQDVGEFMEVAEEDAAALFMLAALAKIDKIKQDVMKS